MSKPNGELMTQQVLPPWVMKMRQAAMDAISENDIKAIVQAQVERAKKGDANALKFIFDQVLGGAELKGATFVQNVYQGDGERPDKPTAARPGSAEKIEVMRRRVESRNGACVGGDGGAVDLS